MDAKQFDKIIKNRLNLPPVDIPTDAWDLFVRYEQGDAVDTEMVTSSDLAFDDLLREKLHGVGVLPVVSNPNWEMFTSKLDEYEQVDAQTFDHIVQKRLRDVRVSYQPGHWKLLSSLLDIQFTRIAAVLKWKSIEFTVLALLALLWWQQDDAFLSIVAVDQSMKVAEVEPALIEEPTGASERLTVGQENENAAVSVEDEADADVAIMQSNTASDLPDSESLEGMLAEQLQVSGDAQLHPFYTSQAIASVARPVTILGNNRYAFVENMPNTDRLFLTSVDPDWEKLSMSFEEADLLPLLAFRAVERETYVGWRPFTVAQPRSRQWQVSMYGAPEYNRIITPEQQLQDTTIRADRFALGYSGGLGLSWEQGRWALESGFVYTAKEYRPPPVLYVEGTFTSGYTSGGLKEFQLNLVQVPIQLRYSVVQSNRWRMYTLLGASLQVALETNYFVADQESFGAGSPATLAFRGATSQRRPSSIEEKNLTGGLFEGGNFRDNSFFTANLGLGLERVMTSRWSVFAQPTYHHTFFSFDQNGVGPENDRLHTMSIFTGIRVRLSEE